MRNTKANLKLLSISILLFSAQAAKADTEPQGCYYIKSYNGKFLHAQTDRIALEDKTFRSKFNISLETDRSYIRVNHTGRFISARQKDNNDHDNYGSVGFQSNALGWEEFSLLEKDHSGKYYIRSREWGTYLRANAKDVIDQTNIAQEWELFELVKTDCETVQTLAKPEPNKCYFIKSQKDRFLQLAASGVLLGDDLQKTEFVIERKNNDFFIKTSDGVYLSASPPTNDSNRSGAVRHQRYPLKWEAFNFDEKEQSKAYQIKSSHWNTFFRDNGGRELAHTDANDDSTLFEFQETKCSAFPKIIWGFWDKGEAALPAFNKYAVLHWRHLLEPLGYRVRILNLLPDDENNAIFVLGGKELLSKNFDELDRIVKGYRLPNGAEVKMVPAVVKSDLIRLALLEKFGGIWMDTSNALLRPLDNFGLAAFKASAHTVSGYVMEGYASAGSPVVKGVPVDGFENWFIAAKKGSSLISAWRKVFVAYWENRKPGQLIEESPLYRIPQFTFGGLDSNARNYLNQHAALKLVLFREPSLGQQIFPLTTMQPWWLHGRFGGDAQSLYKGIIAPSMQKDANDLANDHVGLLKFAGEHLSVIKEHFKSVEDFCRTPNLIALLYGHCP